jgi:AcrR family transcriptional regulator
MARLREFDEQALLDGATELFWSKGYDSTSIEDVSVATGVGNGSIYAAYGNKLGLFLRAFERYCAQRAEFVDAVLRSAGGSPQDAVRAYFEAIIADCASQPGRRGCLMINSVAQLGHRVPEVLAIATEATQQMEASVRTRLRSGGGTAFARFDDAQLALLSSHVVLISQGFIHLSRLGATPERLRQLADVSCAALPHAA